MIERIESFERVVITDELSDEVIPVSPTSLKLRLGDGASERTPLKVEEKEILIASHRASALMPFALSGEPIHLEEMRKLELALGLHRTQIYRCISLLRQSPCPMALVRGARGAKRGRLKLDAEVERIVAREIRVASRSGNVLQLETIRDRIDVACDDIGKKCPCLKTIRARIADKRYEILLRKKLGRRRAIERTKAFPGKISTNGALAMVEIDHSPLDIILVSSETRKPIGRAHLTIVIDTHTRVILGFHLGLDDPQVLSVALALVHAILPKDAWLAEHGLSELEWPMYGLMRAVRLDGGAEFKSLAFKNACKKWGVEISYRNKKEDGAIVERVIGTIQTRASQEPGATGSDPKKRRRERAPSEDAQMTLFEANRWLGREVAQRYHYRRHEGIGMSPHQSWVAEHTCTSGITLPAIVTDAKSLLLSFLPEIKRVIGHDGIHAFNERYFNHEIARFIKPGVKRTIKYDARAMGLIYVDCDTGSYIEVPYADLSKPNLPKFELDHLKREKRRQFPSEFDGQSNRRFLRSQDAERRSAHTATKEARRQERLLQGRKVASGGASDDRHLEALANSQEDVVQAIDYSRPAKVSSDGDI
ncbi:Mu transposase C-terminal domain-containing protein [Dyella sp. GSA-30]|uniref:Mu transposase C-terminal domain-containing protein n=1 Tax=Dyella sp. GSA-30 TaxID=2994496 RepID=UPI002490C5A3|nr:Mu transposase C-terminal domain-containing protein [Dyella sp. GSA-30]